MFCRASSPPLLFLHTGSVKMGYGACSIRLHFPEGTSLRIVLEALAKLAGVSILFDESFRDKQVAVELDGVSFREALDILMRTNGLFYKAVGSSSVMVTPRK